MREQKFIVGGEWKKSGNTSPVRNPFDNTELASCWLAGPDDIESAICSAQHAFTVTSRTSGFERSEILMSIASQLTVRKEEFSQSITSEAGKPISFSRSEVDRAIITFQTAAEEAKRITGETVPLDISAATKGRLGIVNRFPIGIVLCITPFNFPLNLVAHKLAPAIASGNSFILKPAPQTPLTSLLLGEVLLNSGLAKTAINILPTTNELAERMVSDDRIAMLSFTGSAAVGWMLKSKAGKKKVVLELGGNAAVIVDKTADVSHAVSRCVLGAYGYAGQVCIKVQRIIAHQSAYERFEKEFVEATRKVVSGNPTDNGTLVGPMISEREAERVELWVKEATQAGATILTGGKRSGSFFAPTVLKNVALSMKVCSEEIFGPVVTLEKFTEISDALTMINSSKYGLQAGIFSNDHAAIQRLYRELNVGGVIVNDYPTFRVDNMPYGGVKDSGTGREGVRYAMEEMMEKKLLVL
ncbi:MAG: aldehyde dehydrogenase family protein [Bacteroidota bacterium]